MRVEDIACLQVAACRKAVRFVDDTEANELCPEIFNEAPWRYPLAVTLVPDPFVKNKLGKRP